MELTESSRQTLLNIARTAIVGHVSGLPFSSPDAAGELGLCAGAFVSIHHDDRLRGCIGHIEADQALALVVARSAVAACSADPRFAPLAAAELAHVDIEISVLGPLERVADVEEIVVGRDGLLVERGRYRGLLLPQVAVEWRWDRNTFLEQTCHNAGLPPDAWRSGAAVRRFEANVFRSLVS